MAISAAIMGALGASFRNDAFFANVTALLHMDGGDASTVFSDVKGHSFTAIGNAKQSAAQVKFGASSAYFDGSGDYITTPSSADFTFGTGDFTIEFFVYPLAYGGTVCGPQFFGSLNGSTSGWSFHLGENQSRMRLTSNLSGTWADNLVVGTNGGPSLNTWSHIAICRQGANIKIFKDGVTVASGSSFGSFNFGSGTMTIGRFNDGSTIRDFNGYIDELRITKAARYMSDFTPPSQPFPEN